jgi:hypothetical protein
MLDYATTMRIGASGYQDVLDALDRAGLPAEFTQTGGMNAALQVTLEGGRILLITDADDALSWDRAEQLGWGVGLYADQELGDGAQIYDSCQSNDPAALLDLIRSLLRRFHQQRRASA